MVELFHRRDAESAEQQGAVLQQLPFQGFAFTGSPGHQIDAADCGFDHQRQGVIGAEQAFADQLLGATFMALRRTLPSVRGAGGTIGIQASTLIKGSVSDVWFAATDCDRRGRGTAGFRAGKLDPNRQELGQGGQGLAEQITNFAE